MCITRRWFAVLLLALGLLPSADRILLAHVHESAGPVLSAAAAGEGAHAAGGEAWLDCATCHSRAALDALAIDAHPERHDVAPADEPLPELCAAPSPAHAETPPARGPPLRIV
jgi:hypothetical protein